MLETDCHVEGPRVHPAERIAHSFFRQSGSMGCEGSEHLASRGEKYQRHYRVEIDYGIGHVSS